MKTEYIIISKKDITRWNLHQNNANKETELYWEVI